MKAKIRQNEDGQLRGDLENGTSIFGTTAQIDAFAADLFAAGVRHGEVMCGDWREEGSVLGHAVRLNHVLSSLGQGKGMPAPLPWLDEDDGPAPTHEELMAKISYRTEYECEQRIAARRRALLADELPDEEPPSGA